MNWNTKLALFSLIVPLQDNHAVILNPDTNITALQVWIFAPLRPSVEGKLQLQNIYNSELAAKEQNFQRGGIIDGINGQSVEQWSKKGTIMQAGSLPTQLRNLAEIYYTPMTAC